VHCTKISAEFECGVIAPWVCIPAPNVAWGYDVRKISAGCLVPTLVVPYMLITQLCSLAVSVIYRI